MPSEVTTPRADPTRYPLHNERELQLHTAVLDLQRRCETAGIFLCQRKNADGSVTLTAAELTQLLLILGA